MRERARNLNADHSTVCTLSGQYCIAGNFCLVQILAFFTGMLVTVKIKAAKI